MNCPACANPVVAGSLRCEACGRALSDSSDATTRGMPARKPRAVSAPGRFRPGDVLAGRYRIVECVGQGGMGEVYHAEDLTLEQPVALKLLPQDLSRDEERLKRLRREVRVARQISHPHVCRVHDIGEADGLPFLSMEYIRGEDLRSLLRRIGRLPAEKAVEIAAQITSGLAAAHDKGILHRDLKPANVMVDERGQALITDFGLAAAAGTVESRDIRSGTPAYMAPEQWAGTEVTERSDLYSLGLVLYELFTGRLPYSAGTGGPAPPQSATPPPPSKFVAGLDPAVERVILQCLDKEPTKRPASAASVRAAFPGGDLLAAAVARGETPPTALVAAAGDQVGLSPGAAWASLAFVLVALPLNVWLASQTRLSQLVPLPKSPEVLIADARTILTRLGYPGPQRDHTYGFSRDTSYLDHLMAKDPPPSWALLARGDPSIIRFWYRESPRSLVSHRTTEFFPAEHDPPASTPGAVDVELDPRGRLRRLEAVPPDLDDSELEEAAPDWGALFTSAGLAPEAFATVTPRWFPPRYADARAAWEGVYPDAPEVKIRIEAAAFRGRPISFRVVEPWTAAKDAARERGWTRPEDVVPSPWARLAHMGFHLLFILGVALLARHNLRQGRGDAKLALRLAGVAFALVMASWTFGAHHVAERAELEVFFGALYRSFFAFGLSWLFYMALEPYARRLWPRSMISWVRLMDGRFRDPVVGRDVLLGCVYATSFGILTALVRVAPAWFGRLPSRPDLPAYPAELLALRGVTASIAQLLTVAVNLSTHVMFLIGGLLLLRFVLRRTSLAVAVHGILYTVIYAPAFPLGFLYIPIWIGVWYFFYFRFGWVSLITTSVLVDALLGYPLTTNLSAWYGHATVLVVLLYLVVALYAFKVSLGGRPAFRDLLGEQ